MPTDPVTITVNFSAIARELDAWIDACAGRPTDAQVDEMARLNQTRRIPGRAHEL